MLLSVFYSLLFFCSIVQQSHATAGEPYNVEAGDDCKYALQTLILQDISDTFKDDLAQMKAFLPSFLQSLVIDYPFSKFAFATFSDHPFPNVGFTAYAPEDYCFRMDVDFTTNATLVAEHLDNVQIVSGIDFEEAQLDAILHAARGNRFLADEWTPNGHPYVRLLIVSTDAVYHKAGDLAAELLKHEEIWENQPEAFPPEAEGKEYTVKPNNGDGVLECSGFDHEDYPTIDQVGQALADEKVMVIFTVTLDEMPVYSALSAELESKFGVWSYVSLLADDSSNIVEAIEEGLTEMKELICLTSTTTTTSTVTTTTTTTTTTVTSTSSLELTTDGENGVGEGSIATFPDFPIPSSSSGADEPCLSRMVLDFFMVQDITASYRNDLPHLTEKMPGLVAEFKKEYRVPRFGLATFGDKPIRPLGSPISQDYCYQHHASLSNDEETMNAWLSELKTRSGLDWKESQLDAMITASLSNGTHWREEDVVLVQTPLGEVEMPVIRVLAVATDAGFHEAGDGIVVDRELLENVGDGKAGCTTHDYPTKRQTVDAVLGKKISPLFLVTDDVVPRYTRFAHEFEEAGGFASVATLKEDSSNIVAAIVDGLEELCKKYMGEWP